MVTFVIPFLGPITYEVVHNLGTPNSVGVAYIEDTDARSLQIDLWDRSIIIWQHT